MEIKQNIVKKLNAVYNFVLDHEVFDYITTLVLGQTTQELKAERDRKSAERIRQELEDSNNLLLDTLVSEYEDKTQRLIARQILVNELQYISTEEAAMGNKNVDVLSSKKSWLMCIAARVVRTLMTFDGIIGIQPMQGPVGLIYHLGLSPVHEEETEEPTNNEEQLNKAFNSVQQVKLEITSKAIEAMTRKLQTVWTIEAMQDMETYRGIDIEAEIISAISHEVAYEISNELIGDLVALAEQNPASTAIATRVPTPEISDQINLIMVHLNKLSTLIAKTTRRGAGNKIITTPLGVALLQSSSHVRFVPVKTDKIGGFNSLMLVGYLTTDFSKLSDDVQYQYAVYSTLSPSIHSNNSNEIKFLVAYKGNSATDTGYIYAPYIPVITSGVVVDSQTFQPLIQLKTRAGKWTKWFKKEDELSNVESNNIGKSSDYYALLNFEFKPTNE